MIISTNKSDTMLKRSLGKNQTSIIAIDKMIEQFSLDPQVTNPVRDAYVVTNEDISAARLKTKFEQALATKHPAVKVIFINKSTRPIYQNGLPGLDVILQKPKPADITQAISAVIASSTVVEAIVPQAAPTMTIPEFNPTVEENVNYTVPVEEIPVAAEPEPVVQPEEINIPEPVVEPAWEQTNDIQKESALANRIKDANSVADVSVITREITASTLIKDIIDSNSTYAGIEEKLKSLNDSIFLIMKDDKIKSLEEKLSRVRALLHDKAFFAAKGDTLIEQRLEEVIDVICSKTAELLESRLSEIDTAIKRSREERDMEVSSARLAGLNEERANIIIELRTLEMEIGNIFKSCDNLVVSTATHIAESCDNITGNEMINMHLKARGTNVVSDETITAIRSAFELSADKVPTAFKEMKIKIISMTQLLGKLFDLDNEIIAAQQEVIKFLKAHKVEDTVIAETLLKKSLRVFIGAENTGRTIIPYLLSRYKSRQNANVLLLDLTGESKYTQYGIQYTDVDTYLAELNQQEFMLVAGKIDNSVAAAQRIVTTLIKAADYYRVINVILTPEQQDLFQTIAQDVLSINFIVDTNVKNIEETRKLIENCTITNVARRVIINKCDVPIRTIITKLGLDDQIDFQVCTVPTIPVLTDAGLNGYNPYGISTVDLAMEETIKHA